MLFTEISCGGNMTGYGGIVQTAGYPDHYYNNSRCTWEIKVRTDQRIVFTILDFNIEGQKENIELSSTCYYDKMEISENGTLLER